MLAEIGQVVVEQTFEHLAVENVNTHGSEVKLLIAFDAQVIIFLARNSQAVQKRGILGFLDKAGDAAFGIDLQNAEGGGVAAVNRDAGDGDVGLGLSVLGEDALEIHAVELVAAEDDHVVEVVIEKVDEVFADGVSGTLVPGGVRERLFGGENFDEAAAEVIEFVGLGNMAMQRGGVELGKQVNAAQIGIDAIGDGDVHQAIFAGERDRWFGALFGKREKASALSAAHNDRQHIAGIGGHAPSLHKLSSPFFALSRPLYTLQSGRSASSIRAV